MIWLSLFLQLHCCGVYNYTSWFSSVYFPISGIPTSCCVHVSDCNEADLKNTTLAAQKVYKEVRQAQIIHEENSVPKSFHLHLLFCGDY